MIPYMICCAAAIGTGLSNSVQLIIIYLHPCLVLTEVELVVLTCVVSMLSVLLSALSKYLSSNR